MAIGLQVSDHRHGVVPSQPRQLQRICPEETKALVWCGLLFVLEISVRVCGMLFSDMSLYFRASLKAVYTDPWLVLAGEIQFVWLMDFPVPSSFLA